MERRMTPMNEKMETMRAWAAQLNAAADAYYNGRGERMTDFEWDDLFDRLKALEADTGETLGGEFGALFDWLAACLERGSVEEYEFRVSCY